MDYTRGSWGIRGMPELHYKERYTIHVPTYYIYVPTLVQHAAW